MKTKNIFLLAIALVISFDKIHCQDNSCVCKGSSEIIPENESLLTGKAFNNKFVSNNVQYFNSWSIGTIYLKDSTIVKNKYLRYNALLDEILWMRNSDYQVAVLERSKIDKVEFFDKGKNLIVTFEKVDHKNIQHPENEDMFLQLLVTGEVNLYKKAEVVENKSNAELVKRDFYFLYKNGEYINFQNKRILFVRAFGADKKLIRHILRSNFFMVRNESNLIKAVEIYNQLAINK
jgi:hypothetical protein